MTGLHFQPHDTKRRRLVMALQHTAHVHQSSLIRLLNALEESQAASGVDELPQYAEALRDAVWPFLQHYGRRDERGAVDDSTDDQIKPWRPGDDD